MPYSITEAPDGRYLLQTPFGTFEGSTPIAAKAALAEYIRQCPRAVAAVLTDRAPITYYPGSEAHKASVSR